MCASPPIEESGTCAVGTAGPLQPELSPGSTAGAAPRPPAGLRGSARAVRGMGQPSPRIRRVHSPKGTVPPAPWGIPGFPEGSQGRSSWCWRSCCRGPGGRASTCCGVYLRFLRPLGVVITTSGHPLSQRPQGPLWPAGSRG